MAALCLIGLAATWAVSALVPSARAKDALALHDFTLLSRPNVDSVANALLHVLEPAPFTALGWCSSRSRCCGGVPPWRAPSRS